MTAAAYHRLATGAPRAGLLIVRQSLPISTAIEGLLQVLTSTEAEMWHGRVIFLPLQRR